MRYLGFLFLLFFSSTLVAQETVTKKVSGTIVNENNMLPLANVNIINLNQSKGIVTNNRGFFEIPAEASDTLHISCIGFQSIKVKVTNDWIKSKTARILLTEKAIALEEVKVRNTRLLVIWKLTLN
jgi:hypothetical protein